jgi:glutamyl/glutaminyl-tRNA synthetase
MRVIYPMYDFSHPIADALEGITHSLCTLEFEVTDRFTIGLWQAADGIDIGHGRCG